MGDAINKLSQTLAPKVVAARPSFPDEDLAEILGSIERVLRSGRLILGEHTHTFEEAFRLAVDTDYAVAVSSCSAALRIVFRFHQVNGREVILPTNNFPGTVSALLDEGGIPVLADMDPHTFCLGTENAISRITPRTAGFVVVHLAGLVYPDIDHLRDVCQQRGLFLIEDVAHAHGATIDGRKAGGLADAGCFSFYPTKIMTTGTGGIITTNHRQLADFARCVRHHGQGSTPQEFVMRGSDWCMGEIQAILGLQQLKRLDENIAHRHRVVELYRQQLVDADWVSIPSYSDHLRHVYYKFPVLLSESIDATRFRSVMRTDYQIENGTIYDPPCHRQPVFHDLPGFANGQFPKADSTLAHQFCPPVHATLSDEEVTQVARAMHEAAARCRSDGDGPRRPSIAGEKREKARCLFILSNDYGELALAQSLLKDQEFSQRSTLFMPQRLYASNQNSSGVPSIGYRTLRDIVRHMQQEPPNVVFLLSGYLLSNNKLLSRGEVAGLVHYLRVHNCQIVTSDPWVGMASQLAGVEPMSQAPENRPWLWYNRRRDRRQWKRLVTDLTEVAETLQPATHIYPTTLRGLPDSDGIHRVAVFNPNVIDEPSSDRSLNETPTWLFILSTIDARYHRLSAIGDAFYDMILRLLRQTVEAGRRPVLIGPQFLVDAIELNLPSDVPCELVAFCSHGEFQSRLLEAEYVFYWNVFSCSVLHRIANELPVFWFDRGHLSRVIPGYYDRGVECHYAGLEPSFLNPSDDLDPNVLSELAEINVSNSRKIKEQWLNALTPVELLDQLLANSPPAVVVAPTTSKP